MTSTLTALTVGDIVIRQHNGLFSLNDLHQASGGDASQRPSRLLKLNRSGYRGGSNFYENGAMKKTATSNKFSPEVRERAVRLMQEHRGEYPSL